MTILHSGSNNNIKEFDFNHPGYITKLVNQDFTKIVKAKPDNFFDKLAESFEINKYKECDRNVISHIIYDKPEYFYEIYFLDIYDKEKFVVEYENQFATMINSYGETVFGNMVILKTHIPNNKDKSMVLDNMTKSDLFEILDTRVNTKVVVLQDGEFREDVVRGDMDVYCKNLFEEEHYIKKELAFLMHNINIYYVKDEYGTNISPHLTNDKIECAVFFTLNQESIRGNLTLNELEKILELSKSLDYFRPKEEWISEEKDELERDVVKNKYKVLEYAWNDYKSKL